MQHGAILKNTVTNRLHPILFRAAPRPSDTMAAGCVCRHVSTAHHTDGFKTAREADAFIDALEGVRKLDATFLRDGQVKPVMSMDLEILNGKTGGEHPSGL